MSKLGVAIGIIGGIGLGLLLGSEFTGQYSTLLGAVLMAGSLLSMGVLSYKQRTL